MNVHGEEEIFAGKKYHISHNLCYDMVLGLFYTSYLNAHWLQW